MALSDKWTLSQLRTMVRDEILDPTGTKTWSWPNAELNTYITQWQHDVQYQFELVWATATTTVTTGTATITLAAVATDVLRPDAIYWNNARLVPKTLIELDSYKRDWRSVATNVPVAFYQQDDNTVSFYPGPNQTKTVIFEYPQTLALATDTTPMSLPAWTKYTCINYVAMRCYERAGPRQDLNKAARYRAAWDRDRNNIRIIKDSYQPAKYLTLRIGEKYERDVLQPDRQVK